MQIEAQKIKKSRLESEAELNDFMGKFAAVENFMFSVRKKTFSSSPFFGCNLTTKVSLNRFEGEAKVMGIQMKRDRMLASHK